MKTRPAKSKIASVTKVTRIIMRGVLREAG